MNLLQQKEDWSRLLHAAEEVRRKHLAGRRPTSLRDIYTVTYFMGEALRGEFENLVIMVGDYNGRMHHWLEIAERGIFVDAAADATEGEAPVRVGYTYEDAFVNSYARGRESRFRLDEPRDEPKYVFADEGPTSTYRD